jgi:hypothetical protein
MRITVTAVALFLFQPTAAFAEWQLKPFATITWGGSTTFVDLEQAAGTANAGFGVSAAWLGDVIGIEADLSRAPGFFQRGFFWFGGEDPLPPSDVDVEPGSSVTTVTGSVIVAVPRRLTEYTLRPYFAGGGGVMRVAIDGALSVRSTLPVLSAGGGVTGFLSDRFGLGWDLRRFWSVAGKDRGEAFSFGPEQLSFWRASMALAIRY